MSTVLKQHHSIVIAAPAEQVYSTMIDPEAYKRSGSLLHGNAFKRHPEAAALVAEAR